MYSFSHHTNEDMKRCKRNKNHFLLSYLIIKNSLLEMFINKPKIYTNFKTTLSIMITC
jgi:hypothetical protein